MVMIEAVPFSPNLREQMNQGERYSVFTTAGWICILSCIIIDKRHGWQMIKATLFNEIRTHEIPQVIWMFTMKEG